MGIRNWYKENVPEPFLSLSIMGYRWLKPGLEPWLLLPKLEKQGFSKTYITDSITMHSPQYSRFPNYAKQGKHGKHSLRGFVEVEPGDVVFDVGAFIGEFTLPAAHVADRVVSVEPDPQNAYFLRLNSAELQRKYAGMEIHVFNRAAWKKNGQQTFHRADNKHPTKGSLLDSVHAGEISETYTVETSRIDEIADRTDVETIDFLKLDAEGVEPEVLDGAANVDIEKMVVAGSPERYGETTVDEVRSILESRGYWVRVSGEIPNTDHNNPYMVYARR